MEKRHLVEEIIELHRQVNRLFWDSSSGAWMAMNLTRSQLKSLFYIGRERDVNFRKLAAALGFSPSNLTGVVDRLVEQGLVTRNDNPEDRRVIDLRITEKGGALITDLREHRTKLLSDILEHMTTEEISLLARGYAVLLKAAEVHQKEKVSDNTK